MKNLTTHTIQVFLVFSLIIILAACSSKKQVEEVRVMDKGPDQVEIFMAKGVEMKDIEQEFSGYGIKSKGLSSRSQNIAIFSFNNSEIPGEKLLKILIESDMIMAAKLMDGTMGGSQSGKSGKKKTVILNQ